MAKRLLMTALVAAAACIALDYIFPLKINSSGANEGKLTRF
jgi:hypothetical protein